MLTSGSWTQIGRRGSEFVWAIVDIAIIVWHLGVEGRFCFCDFPTYRITVKTGERCLGRMQDGVFPALKILQKLKESLIGCHALQEWDAVRKLAAAQSLQQESDGA